MNTKELLVKAVHYNIYEHNKFNKELKRELDTLAQTLTDYSKLKNLLEIYNTIKTTENTPYLDNILEYLLSKNTYKLEDILRLNTPLKVKKTFFLKSSTKEKLNYLKDKKIKDELLLIVNDALTTDYNFTKAFLKSSFSIEGTITPALTFLDNTTLSNETIIKTFNKELTTKLVNKYIFNYNDFQEYYLKNPWITKYLAPYKLHLKNISDTNFKNFIKENSYLLIYLDPNISAKYLSSEVISSILKSHSSKSLEIVCKELLSSKNNTLAKEYFTLDFLKKVSPYSLSLYPFHYLDNELTSKIIYNYDYLKKFNFNCIYLIISKYYHEEEIIDLLRNKEFTEDVPGPILEKILSLVSFKQVFNMLQNKTILEKVSNLEVKLKLIDKIFITGYLDSPTLVSKTNYETLKNMFYLVDHNTFKDYLKYPYIHNKLRIVDILDIFISHNENIFYCLDYLDNIKFNKNELTYYINASWRRYGINYSLVFQPEVFDNCFKYRLANLSKEDRKNIKYLFDTIYTKGQALIECSTIDLDAFKSVVISYKLLGLSKTLELFNRGNHSTTLNKVLKLCKNELEILSKKESKEYNFKIKEALNELKATTLEDIDKTEYLHDILKDMDTYNYSKYTNSVVLIEESKNKKDKNAKIYLNNLFNNYKEYHNNYICNNIKYHFNEIIQSNYKIKDNIKYRYQKETGKEFLSDCKLKILMNTLTSSNLEDYQKYYKDIDITELMNTFTTYLSKYPFNIDVIIHDLLYPYALNNKSIKECLEHVGINCPEYALNYFITKQETLRINKINQELNKVFKHLQVPKRISILNHICYNYNLDFSLSTDISKYIEDLRTEIINFNGKVDVSKTTNNLVYTNLYTFNNIDELDNYYNYLIMVEKLAHKAKIFANKYIIDSETKALYREEYTKVLESTPLNLELNTHNYYLVKRNLTLDDFKHIFYNMDILDYEEATPQLYNFLLKNIPYFIDGYYKCFLNSFKDIILNWNSLSSIKDLNLLKAVKYLGDY